MPYVVSTQSSSERMKSLSTVIELDRGDEEEWQVIESDWWRNPVSDASWTYLDEEPFKKPINPVLCPDSLYRCRQRRRHRYDTTLGGDYSDAEGVDDEGAMLVLNLSHVAARLAEDVLRVYEENVGFNVCAPGTSDLPADDSKTLFERCDGVTKDDVAVHRHLWDEMTRDLGGSKEWRNLSDKLEKDMERSSTFAPFDVESVSRKRSPVLPHASPLPTPMLPSASSSVSAVPPRQTKSCDDFGPSPSTRLNAHASSFVPISPPSGKRTTAGRTATVPPPLHSEFTFPSLSVPPVPSVKIQKDEQGFYSGVDEDGMPTAKPQQQQSTVLLPPFLCEAKTRRKSPASKTRSLVNGLRSVSRATSPSPRMDVFRPRLTVSEDEGEFDAPSSDELDIDGDGWIGVTAETRRDILTTVVKAKRSRGLVMVETLARHRSDSSLSSQRSKDEDLESAASTAPPVTPSPSRSVSAHSHDGWVEPVIQMSALSGGLKHPKKWNHSHPQQQTQPQHKKKHSSSAAAPVPLMFPPNHPFTPNVPPFVFPGGFFVPAPTAARAPPPLFWHPPMFAYPSGPHVGQW